MREDEIVSEPLLLRAHVLPNGEVCWAGDDIEAALREIADAGQVILGFEILEPLPEDTLNVWGWSGFEVDAFLESTPWNDCVRLALDAAITEVPRHTSINGTRAAFFRPLGASVNSVDQLGEAKLRKLPKTIFVRCPENEPGKSP